MYEELKTLSEKQLKEWKVPYPKTKAELDDIINNLAERKQDYGTCVYAMSIASVATFNYMSHIIGSTGFQASCADLDIIRRTRNMKLSFKLLNYENLLFPQYFYNKERFPDAEFLLQNNIKELGLEVVKRLKNEKNASKEVINHWNRILILAKEKAKTDLIYEKELVLETL